ncbi:unnamed protein product [Rotaria sp. Silwood2]|nr:unnamed protein product [Rotaria sp. Silwood2]CAF3049917.1 unnamed protein product [Rotaria sp. Silwood2]CAF3469007.1 unnamed protein product [Rotaria sp. Silwood2]CAF4292503.1 unnamed protein product [Rotaria sp. Silwood2]CAF4607055.1 unnamed protein product [Rotaria sp. Silwood2]
MRHNKQLDRSDFVKLFSKLYDYALLPVHCAPSFSKSGIYPYDPQIIRKDKLINNEVDASVTTINATCLTRSLSVEFNDPPQSQYSTSAIATTIKQKK